MGIFQHIIDKFFASWTIRGGTITGLLVTVLLSLIMIILNAFFWISRVIFPESGYNIDNFVNLLAIPILVVLCHSLFLLGILYDAGDSEVLEIQYTKMKIKIDVQNIWKRLEKGQSGKIPVLIITLYFLGLVSFNLGQGIHSAADFLNSRAIDLDIKALRPEYYQHVWFLDEVVGHWFAYTGFWMMIFVLGFMNLRIPSKREMNRSMWIILVLVTLSLGGFLWVLFALEGEYGFWSLGIAVVYISYFGLELHKLSKNSSYSAQNFPVVWFLVLFFFFSIPVLLIVFMISGGKFIQPSDIFKAVCCQLD
ncbi:MAG: hypothetical protein ACFFFG_08950 [Candidatus Thorarchaeota archaeon]